MICWDVSNASVFRNWRPRSISRPKPKSYCHPAYEPGCKKTAIPQETYAFVEPRNITEYRTDIINAPINKRAFIGISGLAKTFASLTGRTYFAGIWLETWMQGVLWESDKTMIAPSWSWLSYSGSVVAGPLEWRNEQALNLSTTDPSSFKSDDYQPLAFLVQSILTPLDTDPFTSFEQALLKIRCLLIPVEFSESTDVENLADFCWQDHNPEHSITFDSAGLDCMRVQSCDALSQRVQFRVRFSKIPDPSSSLFLLPLYLQKENCYLELGEDPEAIQAGGLVLQESFDNGDREFIRVGMWKESLSYASQLGPMISNTIVTQAIGKSSSGDDESITEAERIFGSNLFEYALHCSSSEVNFPIHYETDDEVMGEAETREDQSKREMMQYRRIQCSLLPHFTVWEWTIITLV
ncbi:hypothetical protein FPHYL_13546 [Fusarium phyllophilum]|uniref:Uncharacterized protein n=1 Tax=Fusarium phyllophilum TaxID=47803 RepID=A0A8H5ICN7_9HYPO|nr:hypothetical protein FPHYL_13546 [Fusarium phyllophilum]